MKERFLKALHFLKLDVLLLRVLERLLGGLTKKREALEGFLSRFLTRPTSATDK